MLFLCACVNRQQYLLFDRSKIFLFSLIVLPLVMPNSYTGFPVHSRTAKATPGRSCYSFNCHISDISTTISQSKSHPPSWMSIACDECSSWFHTDCIGLHTCVLDALANSHAEWLCSECGMPNQSFRLPIRSPPGFFFQLHHKQKQIICYWITHPHFLPQKATHNSTCKETPIS